MAWNGSQQSMVSSKKKTSRNNTDRHSSLPYLLGVLVLIILAFLGYKYLQSRDIKGPVEKPASNDGNKAIAEHEADLAPVEDFLEDQEVIEELPKPPKYLPQDAVLSTVTTNSGRKVVEVWLDGKGRKHKVYKNARKPIFTNRSDQMLAMVVSQASRPGSHMAPFPNMTDEDMNQAFADSLKVPIIINDDDTEEIKERKKGVLEARQDMYELIGKGMSVREALEQYRTDVNRTADLRNMVSRELKDLLKAGDQDLAEDFLKNANDLLEQSGAEALEMPDPEDLEEE